MSVLALLPAVAETLDPLHKLRRSTLMVTTMTSDRVKLYSINDSVQELLLCPLIIMLSRLTVECEEYGFYQVLVLKKDSRMLVQCKATPYLIASVHHA
jgi:hypothetical protein